MTAAEGTTTGDGQADAWNAENLARIGALLERASAIAPSKPALADEVGVWTYKELAVLVADAAACLTAMGAEAGARVAVIGGNTRATAAWLLAGWACGACVVPVNPKLAGSELDAVLTSADPWVSIFCLEGSAHLRAYAAARGIARTRGCLGDVGFRVGSVGPDGCGSEAQPADTAAIIFTSGTSGKPKGVMLTHSNLLFMAASSGAVRQVTARDRFYLVMPISHIVGLSVILLGGLMHLACVQMAAEFHPRALLRALADDAITILLGNPSLFRFLADHAGNQRVSAPSLRIISASGAPLDQATKAAAEAMFGLPMHHGYGLTECAPTIAQVRPGEETDDCTVGRLLPGIEARLDGADGEPAAPGCSGELLVRGPNVMAGYFRDAAATALVLDRQGWFRTGDLARFDGPNLHITGRAKEMVIRFGYNVYPAEVEAVLASHPAVALCAVLGRTAQGEEELVAFVQPRPAHELTQADLANHAAVRLASYKRPSRYVIAERLPLNESGKVRKHELATA